ncbi:hypothetical protein [Lacinutrix salivirga]
MKKLLIIALALVGLNATAQDKEKRGNERGKDKMERFEHIKDISPEEMAQIQTKKMTLLLDLNNAQQQQVQAINLKNAKERKTMMEKRIKSKDDKQKPSKEKRLKMTNDRLDKAIAQKRQMKTILNPEQYAKWEKRFAKKAMKRKHKMKGKKRGNKKQK